MTKNKMINLKWEVKKRQEEIECQVYWVGYIHRRHLIVAFGISPQQASADLALYQKVAPDNLIFNKSLKRYEATGNFKPCYITAGLNDYLSWSNRFYDSVSMVVPSPIRSINPAVVKLIANALNNEQSIEILYQSMTTPAPSLRRITPHTIVYDGLRYHVRSYCHLRNEFRDFVLGRIIKAGHLDDAGKTKVTDDKWNTLVALRIAPHPDLSSSQKKIIEQDYGMTDGELLLRVRESMLMYSLTQLRLDRFAHERTPAEQQIVLLNPDVVMV